MSNQKIHAKTKDGQSVTIDLLELVTEKYNIDPDTIKDLEFVKVLTQVQRRHFKKGEFFMQSMALDKLVMNRRYNLNDLRLLVALRSRLDFNNRIRTFRQIELAVELESSQANISRAFKKLVDDGIIYKDGHDYYFSDVYIKGAGDRK